MSLWLPQLGIGGRTPKPRKLRAASTMIVVPVPRVMLTMMGAMELGIMCRVIIFQSDMPRAWEAGVFLYR